ncbi:sensor histidine kinase [Anaerotruncus massiliensis (ex Liu et al. 2021)]|mgnify:FL=1|uniref:histidine kinase n=2 Tax=Anaerotruncus TaxID=244127 RepID=A0A498CM45_9FIRM|nr:HAMP domain-containing sensor histidine kinase [Anaerotruncus massiliensis (ex Liu et al. 2021)]MBC3939865.1 HAMP domain-containing histidine kinase [Anaerotruncus massiliensis (ex Togo et al. 2019)]RLL07671.1 sensor histidine kinase [Anaerotruncus massiliensis (ex Liu et al. 2021)]
MAVKKITKRWLFNNLGVILVILIALEIGFAFGIRAFYYNNVQAAIMTQANIVVSQLTAYAEDSSAVFSEQVRSLVENFQERNRMELMTVDIDKKVTFTSSGFEPGSNIQMPDFDDAMKAADGVGRFTGVINGEKIMAITRASPVVDQQIAAVRFAVSLDLVDQQIILFILILTLVCVAIIFFVIFSGSYFINSIVNPVGEVGVTARKIAHGDFNARLAKRNDDEIGELCDTINYMAEELSQSERMKNDFISSVSHELRTPLTAIKGWAETIADMGGEVDPEMLSKGMRVITGETERLAGMVEELLDFSRIQSGRMKLVKDKMDLIAELSEAVLMFEERAKHEEKRLIYEEPDLVAPIEGDRNRLRQVFVNIIDNALKYSDRGDTVTIKADMRDGNIRITVADTGCGIREQDLPKVKEKFFKANSTRRGSGIGLAVADEIVAMHGGSLELTSKENVGTRVTILLPTGKS